MERPQNLRDYLKDKLTDEEKKHLTVSFDIIGDIAVIEVKDELKKKEKLIGEAILSTHKNVHTVCKRAGKHKGIFRVQKLKVIAGEKKKETFHKESGCTLKLDVEKCYFSVRSSTERLRICKLLNDKYKLTGKKESILVMFSGIGPYTCVIGKNAVYKNILGVELNPVAHEYAVENTKLNKIKSAENVLGDVRKIVPNLSKQKKRFDRIIMPLPRTAEEFLDTALIVSKKGTVIHLYGFLGEQEFESYKEKVANICKENKKKIRINDFVKCGQFSPKIFRICVDFEIL